MRARGGDSWHSFSSGWLASRLSLAVSATCPILSPAGHCNTPQSGDLRSSPHSSLSPTRPSSSSRWLSTASSSRASRLPPAGPASEGPGRSGADCRAGRDQQGTGGPHRWRDKRLRDRGRSTASACGQRTVRPRRSTRRTHGCARLDDDRRRPVRRLRHKLGRAAQNG